MCVRTVSCGRVQDFAVRRFVLFGGVVPHHELHVQVKSSLSTCQVGHLKYKIFPSCRVIVDLCLVCRSITCHVFGVR